MNDITDKQFIEAYFSIVNKRSESVPFLYNPVQSKVESLLKTDTHRKVINIVVKSRKQGCSSLFLAKFTKRCITGQNTKAVVISHEKKATQRLLDRTYYYLNSLPVKVPLDTASTDEIGFPESHSSYWIGTAGSKSFGRGDDINLLHISELDFWEHPDMLTGLIEACVDSALIIIETTGNGYNSKTHRMVQRAFQGLADFNVIFLGWNESEEYYITPPADFEVMTIPDILGVVESELQAQYKLSDGQIYWRREKLRNMDNPYLFPQEFPINIHEAFMKSDMCPFDVTILAKWFEKAKEPILTGVLSKSTIPPAHPSLEEIDNNYNYNIMAVAKQGGWIKIFKKPEPHKSYAIGADVAEGTTENTETGNYSTCSVRDRETWEQVATIRCHIDPDKFGEMLDITGRYYNDAVIGVESNNHGLTTLTILNQLHYSRLYRRDIVDEVTKVKTVKLGWRTDGKTKPLMIDFVIKSIRECINVMADKVCIEEHLSFVQNPDGKYEANAGCFDDFVIADAICLQMLRLHPHYDPGIDWMQKQFEGRQEYNKRYMSRMDEYLRHKSIYH